MANIPLQYPFPYKTINSTGFTSSVEFVNVTVLGDVTIDQNLTVSGNITTTDLTVGDDLTVGGQIDAQVLRAFGVWDTPIQTVNGAGAWIGFDGSGHTIFANRKSTAGQTNSFRWYAFDHTNAFQGELMRLSNAGNLFISGTRLEFPLIHFHQPPGTFPNYDFYLPSSMGSAGQVLTSAGAGLPTYWTTPSGGGGGGGTVTNVTGTSPVTVTSPSTTPNISLTTIPTTLGGTGLTTIGTNGQVLSSNGTNLQYVTLPTPVTSVAATSPLASSGGTTPTISIASSTGTGSVVLQTSPTISNSLSVSRSTDCRIECKPEVTGATGLEIRAIGNLAYLDITSQAPSPGADYDFRIIRDLSTHVKFQMDAAVTGGYLFDRFIQATGNSNFIGNFYVSGNVGIGTTTPAYSLDVNVPGIPQFAVREMFNGGFRTQWNYSGGQGETTIFTYRGGGSGGFWFKNLNTSNADVGFATITCGSIYSDGNVGIGTTNPGAKLDVTGDGELLQLSGTNTSFMDYSIGGTVGFRTGFLYNGDQGFYFTQKRNGPIEFYHDGTSGQVTNFYMPVTIRDYINITKPGTGVTAELNISAGTVGSPSVANQATLNFGTVGGGGGTVWTTIKSKYSTTYGYHHEHSSDNLVSLSPIIIDIAGAGQRLRLLTDTTSGINYIQSGSSSTIGSTADLSFGPNQSPTSYLMIKAAGNVGIGTTTPTTKLQVVGTCRATNFTTNGTNTFTYASGTFTPRIAMFYTSDNKVYECNNPPAGKDPIAISYSVQTGVWVRVGNLITINMEIQYSQTYSGVTFDVSNLNIVAVIPEDACKPNTLGAVGVTGYPSRIADRFVDNFQMNYWISNTSYAPGGTICEVQLRRDNTHNMMPWDPTNKGGQRVNITTSYYVLQ